jgi:hypothetical protein
VEGAAAERRSIAGRRRGVSGDRFHTRRQAEETGSIGASRAQDGARLWRGGLHVTAMDVSRLWRSAFADRRV